MTFTYDMRDKESSHRFNPHLIPAHLQTPTQPLLAINHISAPLTIALLPGFGAIPFVRRTPTRGTPCIAGAFSVEDCPTAQRRVSLALWSMGNLYCS
jgi:hypothetical protein